MFLTFEKFRRILHLIKLNICQVNFFYCHCTRSCMFSIGCCCCDCSCAFFQCFYCSVCINCSYIRRAACPFYFTAIFCIARNKRYFKFLCFTFQKICNFCFIQRNTFCMDRNFYFTYCCDLIVCFCCCDNFCFSACNCCNNTIFINCCYALIFALPCNSFIICSICRMICYIQGSFLTFLNSHIDRIKFDACQFCINRNCTFSFMCTYCCRNLCCACCFRCNDTIFYCCDLFIGA